MTATSVTRDSKTADVRRLATAGVSQRQIAAQLGISRPMVQRILDSYDPLPPGGSDVADFRSEIRQALDAIPFATGFVDPMLYQLENAEAAFNAEYHLTGSRAVQAAKLRRMMAEPRGS